MIWSCGVANMRMLMVGMVLIFGIATAADIVPADIESAINELGDEQFQTREEASGRLAKLPKEYAKAFLDMSKKESDPETASRLLGVAKRIFLSKVVIEDESWLALHGAIGIVVASYYESFIRQVNRTVENKTQYDKERDVWVVRVTNLESDAEKKIRQGDIITSIDGNSVSKFDLCHVLPGKKHKMVVMRPLSEPKESDYCDGTIRGKYPEEYEELSIEVEAQRVDERFLDYEKIDELERKLWRAFCGHVDDE